MLHKWFPWKWLLRCIARTQGFMDPMRVLAQIQRFAQPSEVAAPIELLRLASTLQVRGLMNTQAIQHNLDWVWPYWVTKQFDPKDESFVPRAFSMTHINLTHRNWTALGLPGRAHYPLLDPRGLVTPHYDGWSVDVWVVDENGSHLFPSRLHQAGQKLLDSGELAIETRCEANGKQLSTIASVVSEASRDVLILNVQARANRPARLAISLRPANPEGVSFVYRIRNHQNRQGWTVNKSCDVLFDRPWQHHVFSTYREGDVVGKIFAEDKRMEINCEIGLATAAALFEMEVDEEAKLTIRVPLDTKEDKKENRPIVKNRRSWAKALSRVSTLKHSDKKFEALFGSSMKSLILHTVGSDVYPGPYTYKHFWFRDAAFILHALIVSGLHDEAEQVINAFPKRQTAFGHFVSQDGEWDSNGQALWIMERFSKITGRETKPEWRKAIEKGAKWILSKRLSENLGKPHAGLFPAGFSAEHLGPNDYYYWDNFWGVQGLRSAAWLARSWGNEQLADRFTKTEGTFSASVDRSLERTAQRLGTQAMPASPYRRLDSGAIGSLTAGYPLRLWRPSDERLKSTINYLLENCIVRGGFFHDMSHSGINIYLTLQIAQALLRAGDRRFYGLVKAAQDLASPTGKWPEAIHPRTGGGCMGDGEHVWAAAEWVLMVKNMFVREEDDKLVFCSGLVEDMIPENQELCFGPVWTSFGSVQMRVQAFSDRVKVGWGVKWHKTVPPIEVRLPGWESIMPQPNVSDVVVNKRNER